MSESKQSESAGIVKCSEDGVVVIPVEVRKVLDIKDKESFVRLDDISVAEVVDGNNGGDGD